MDFSKFDQQVDLEKLRRDAEEAAKNGGDYPEVPKGTYVVKLEKLELGNTKDQRPMVKGQFRITEGEYEKQCLFYNRVIYGTKNDANMIAAAVGFLAKLEPSEDVGPVEFNSYAQFSDLIMDIMEDVEGALEYEVEYDPTAFNNISITDVFELD